MRESKLKPYMGYSASGGASEGAVLVFAYNIKEAKRLAWAILPSWGCDDYLDMRVHFIKDGDYLFNQMKQWSKDKIIAGISHAVDSPPVCKSCQYWGVGEFNKNGLCPDCEENAHEEKK